VCTLVRIYLPCLSRTYIKQGHRLIFPPCRCEEAALWLQDLLLSAFPSNGGSGSGSSSSSSSSSSHAGPVASAVDAIVAVGHGEFMHLLLKKVGAH